MTCPEASRVRKLGPLAGAIGLLLSPPTALTAAYAESAAPAILVLDGLVFNGQYPDTLPGGVPQSLVSFGPTAESPDGWIPVGGTETIGNNCDAKEDWSGDNEATVGRRADGGASQEFRFPFQNSWALSSDYTTDLSAALVNGFYWVNVWHDWVYRLGVRVGDTVFDNISPAGIPFEQWRRDFSTHLDDLTISVADKF